jgi:tetratricopeptide (TPR) repeat protein
MFIPSSMKMLDVFSASLVDAGIQLSFAVDRELAQKVVLACWQVESKRVLADALSSKKVSPFDDAVSPGVLNARRRHQVKVLSEMLGIPEDLAVLLALYWQPTNRPFKREVLHLKEGVQENSDSSAQSQYENVTFERLLWGCESYKRDGDWSVVGQLALIGVHEAAISPKEPFWMYLSEASNHDFAAKLNLGTALLQVGGKYRDPTRGAAILREFDLQTINVKMKEIVLVSLGQFDEGKHGGRKDLKAACKLYQRAFEECGSARAALHLGHTYLDMGDFVQARRYISEAVRLGYPAAMITLAKMMLLRQTEFDEQLLQDCLDRAAEAGFQEADEMRNTFSVIARSKGLYRRRSSVG